LTQEIRVGNFLAPTKNDIKRQELLTFWYSGRKNSKCLAELLDVVTKGGSLLRQMSNRPVAGDDVNYRE
jgi:hypothetical protein